MNINSKQIQKNLSILVFANFLIALGAFFTSSLIGRVLGPEQFGELSYAVAIGSIIAANTRFGMDMTLLRDLVHYKEISKNILTASIIIRFTILTSCFLLLIIVDLVGFVSISFSQYLIILSTALIALQLNNYYDFIGELKLSSIQNLIYKYSYFLVIAFVAVIYSLNIDIIATIMLSTLVIYLIVNYIKVSAFTIIKSTTSIAYEIKLLLKENYLIWITTLFVMLAYSGNQLTIEKLLNSYELGIFAACYLFVTVILMFYKQISRVFKPIMALYTKNRDSTYKKYLYIYFFIMLGIGVMFSIPFLFFGDLILLYTFGSEYTEGSDVLKYLSVFIMLKSIEIFLTQYFQYNRNYMINLFSNMSFGLTTILLSIYLLPIYGVVGAAISMSVGLSVSLIIILVFMLSRRKNG